jgi:hypothetical protein
MSTLFPCFYSASPASAVSAVSAASAVLWRQLFSNTCSAKQRYPYCLHYVSCTYLHTYLIRQMHYDVSIPALCTVLEKVHSVDPAIQAPYTTNEASIQIKVSMWDMILRWPWSRVSLLLAIETLKGVPLEGSFRKNVHSLRSLNLPYKFWLVNRRKMAEQGA